MDIRSIDILAVQETRCAELPEENAHNHNILHAPAKNGRHGCALILGPRVQVKSFEILEESRLIKAHVKIKMGTKFAVEKTIFSAYFPQRDTPEQYRFTEKLAPILSRDAILLCDANGALPDIENTSNHATCTRYTPTNEWTWKGNNGQSIIDHVMVHKRNAREVMDVTYEQPIISDHRLVAVSLKPKWTKSTTTTKKRLQLHDLAYNLTARKKFNNDYIHIDEFNLKHLHDHISAVSGQWSTKAKMHEKVWQRHGAEEAILQHDDVDNRLEANDIEWTTEMIEEYVKELQKNPWTAWKYVSTTERKQAQVTGAVSAAQLRVFFKASMERLHEPEPPPHFIAPEPLMSVADDDFTIEELRRALSTMKNHTAPGPDGIPIEAYRCPKVQEDVLRRSPT
jgi:hypothetical protein